MIRLELIFVRTADFDGVIKLLKEAGIAQYWEGVCFGIRCSGLGFGNVILEVCDEKVEAFWANKANTQEWGIYAIGLDTFKEDAYDFEKKLDAAGISHAPCTHGVYPEEVDTEGRRYEWDLFTVDTKDTPYNHTFFVQYTFPMKTLSKNLISPKSPITLVEYVIGVPDVKAALAQYSKVFEAEPTADGTFKLDDTVIRIAEGTTPKAVVKSDLPQATKDKLAAAIPGLVFA